MAGHGLGVFELKGIVVEVFTHGTVAFALGFYVRIILIHTLVEGILLLIAQTGGFRFQGVEADFGMHLLVIVVREAEHRVGEMQAIALFVAAYFAKFSYIAVGHITHPGILLEKLVAVLDYHQLVPAQQALLLELDSGAYAEIVAYGHLVGAAQHYRFILPIGFVG